MVSYFCDGLQEITILNGVVRLEFHRLHASGAPPASRSVAPVSEVVLALPAQGFVQAVAMLERLRDELVKQGLVKLPAADANPAKRSERSPNFE